MQNYDVYKLEDNQEYLVVSKINYNNSDYCLLSNINNPRNVCIRKLEKKGPKEYLNYISEEEYNVVINLFDKMS